MKGAQLRAPLLAALLLAVSSRAPAQQLEIAFLDVGQGDAVLLLTPERRTMLVDAGPNGAAVVRYLRALGIDTLDLLWDGPILRSAWSPEARGANTGVHGLKPRFRRYFLENGWFYGRETWAWGWVALSGLVEEFSGGYRAEWGAIRQLRLGPRSLALYDAVEDLRDVMADLEDPYQCRVKVGYHEWRISRTMIPLRSP